MKKVISSMAVATVGLLLSTAASAVDFSIVSQKVQPSATGTGINGVLGETYKHYVVAPEAAGNRKNILVVFLGGSTSTPGDYSDISDRAAQLGYGVIDLRYPNAEVVGTVCLLSDACFRNLRGETIFGSGVPYASGQPTYDSILTNVNQANSIVNRLVALLDYLSHQASGANPPNSYWAQFLTPNNNSPYVTTSSGKVYPNWSKIVIAGHSQGGGHAAFIGTHLPAGTSVRRVVMFSAPNDNINNGSASWVRENTSTPLSRFWGLRNANEGTLGSSISMNWGNLGNLSSSGPAYSYGGVGGTNQTVDTNIGDGSGSTFGTHRLVLALPNALSSTNHNSTATNDPLGNFPANRTKAWDYLFTAGFTD